MAVGPRTAMGTQGWGRVPAETYQIGQQTRAHEGSVFALCRRRDGTVLSGGGKDRRVLSWSPALSLLQEAEVRTPPRPPPALPNHPCWMLRKEGGG